MRQTEGMLRGSPDRVSLEKQMRGVVGFLKSAYDSRMSVLE